MEKIILFDGDCLFCNQSVQFIIKRDPEYRFQFASLKSEIGKEMLDKYQIDGDVDSIVFITDNRFYIKSTAVLHISKHLTGLWKLFYLLIIVPVPLRDYFYNIIARNRYKWFGKTEKCELPTNEDNKRFLSW